MLDGGMTSCKRRPIQVHRARMCERAKRSRQRKTSYLEIEQEHHYQAGEYASAAENKV